MRNRQRKEKLWDKTNKEQDNLNLMKEKYSQNLFFSQTITRNAGSDRLFGRSNSSTTLSSTNE